MQDRDTEVEAEVQWRRVEAMNNAGLRGGESHEGGAPNLVQRGLFQKNRPLPQLGVALSLLASPRPLVMLSWLGRGALCDLRKSLLGESNFKKKKKKHNQLPFSVFSNPNQKSTVCAIAKSRLRSSAHVLTASAKISEEADRNKRVPFSCCIMRRWSPCTPVPARQ